MEGYIYYGGILILEVHLVIAIDSNAFMHLRIYEYICWKRCSWEYFTFYMYSYGLELVDRYLFVMKDFFIAYGASLCYHNCWLGLWLDWFDYSVWTYCERCTLFSMLNWKVHRCMPRTYRKYLTFRKVKKGSSLDGFIDTILFRICCGQ